MAWIMEFSSMIHWFDKLGFFVCFVFFLWQVYHLPGLACVGSGSPQGAKAPFTSYRRRKVGHCG